MCVRESVRKRVCICFVCVCVCVCVQKEATDCPAS